MGCRGVGLLVRVRLLVRMVMRALVLVLVLVGCAGTSQQGSELRKPVPVLVLDLSTDEVMPSGKAANASRSSMGEAERKRIELILALLDSADLAVKSKRLAEPRGDSAVDYYRQVLKLQPGYIEAVQGLDMIVDRYLAWSDAAMRQGRPESAQRYLTLARQVDPGSARVERSAARLKHQRVAPASASVRYLSLDPQQLKAKSPDLVLTLGALADRIRVENARVTIEAPTDSQGRWVYLQLNQRHEDYRVRANFRLEAQPGVRLLD